MTKPVLILTKDYVTTEISLGIGCSVLSVALRPELILIGWLFFSVFLFSTGGWFFRDLGRASGGVFVVIQLFAWPMPIAISRLVAAASFFCFWTGLIVGRVRENKQILNETRNTQVIVKGFFLSLAIVGIGLDLITFTGLLDDWQFWIFGLLMALSGWFFPEVDRALSRKVRSDLRSYADIAVYVLLGLSAVFISVIAGPSPASWLSSWLLFLFLFSLLRGVFMTQQSSQTASIIPL